MYQISRRSIFLFFFFTVDLLDRGGFLNTAALCLPLTGFDLRLLSKEPTTNVSRSCVRRSLRYTHYSWQHDRTWLHNISYKLYRVVDRPLEDFYFLQIRDLSAIQVRYLTIYRDLHFIRTSRSANLIIFPQIINELKSINFDSRVVVAVCVCVYVCKSACALISYLGILQ